MSKKAFFNQVGWFLKNQLPAMVIGKNINKNMPDAKTSLSLHDI